MNASNWASMGNCLQTVGLGLMAGGMLAIGAFAAPVVFKHFPRHEAGAALTVVFTRFDTVLLVSLAMVLVGEAFRFLSQLYVVQHPLALIRYVLMGALAVTLLISTQSVNPSIARMQAQGIHPDASPQGIGFNKQHKLSENLYKFEMLAALGLLLLTPWVPSRQ